MFETLQRLYDSSLLSVEKLRNAVVKEWITAEQYKKICGEVY